MTDDRWAPDPDYAKYPTHSLCDVPLAVLEAARDVLQQAAEYGDFDPDLVQPLADSVISGAMPLIREWLSPRATDRQ